METAANAHGGRLLHGCKTINSLHGRWTFTYLCTWWSYCSSWDFNIKSTFRILLTSQARIIWRFSTSLPVTDRLPNCLKDTGVSERGKVVLKLDSTSGWKYSLLCTYGRKRIWGGDIHCHYWGTHAQKLPCKELLAKVCWLVVYPEVYAGPHAYIVEMCYTNKYVGFTLCSRRTDWPDQNILLLPDRLPERLSQGHLGKVLQGCIDSVADGLVKDTLHPAHQHLQTFDHGNYLKQKWNPDVFSIFPLYEEVHKSNIKRIWD